MKYWKIKIFGRLVYLNNTIIFEHYIHLYFILKFLVKLYFWHFDTIPRNQ